MSSSSYLESLQFATRQINLYGGLFLFIIGIFGELLKIIVFTTLKTFRQTACSFYLIITSIANIGLLIVLFLRIIYDGFNIGLSYTPVLCKFRYFLAQYWVLVSMTSMCLATIDQFISMTTYRQWNTLRMARRLIGFACVCWFINAIFAFIYYDSYLNTCIVTNVGLAKFYAYFELPILFGILPLTVMIIFSILAFLKIRTIASRQLNIVRLSRDRQLTAMTLLHALFIVITNIPFVSFFIYTLIINTENPTDIAYNGFIYAITVMFYYISYSVKLFSLRK